MGRENKRIKGITKDVHYFIGDTVLLEIHSMSNATKAINAKLESKYEGPFTIIEVIAPYVYKVDMGSSRRGDTDHATDLRNYIEKRAVNIKA